MPPPAPDPVAPPRPAATLVLFRETNTAPDLLMVERGAAMRFAAGASVFPGGAVDAADHALAVTLAGPADADDMAARIAAIRETIEETGIAVGLIGPRTPADHAAARADLASDPTLAAMLARRGWRLDPAALVPFTRWQAPFAKGFDTRFYLARVPDDAPAPMADGTENARAWWAPARAVLDAAAAGETLLIFPTYCTLARLAPLAGFAEACADAARHPQTGPIIPRVETVDGESWLTIPAGLGYPTARQPLAQARRG